MMILRVICDKNISHVMKMKEKTASKYYIKEALDWVSYSVMKIKLVPAKQVKLCHGVAHLLRQEDISGNAIYS